MILLHALGTGSGLPGISPLVTTARVRLRMARRNQNAARPDCPKRQLPHTDDRRGALARALTWALERMVEHYLDWALAGARWANPAQFADGAAPDDGH